MSLEIAIQQNTAAINELVALLKGGAVIPPPAEDQALPAESTRTTRKKPKEAAPEAPAGEPEKPAASAPSQASTAAPAQTTEAAAAATEQKQINYSDAAVCVNKVAARKGRAAAVEILAKFGAKTLQEVKASSYGDVIKACEAVL